MKNLLLNNTTMVFMFFNGKFTSNNQAFSKIGSFGVMIMIL